MSVCVKLTRTYPGHPKRKLRTCKIFLHCDFSPTNPSKKKCILQFLPVYFFPYDPRDCNTVLCTILKWKNKNIIFCSYLNLKIKEAKLCSFDFEVK